MKNEEIMKKILKGYTLTPPDNSPPNIKKAMKQCWNLDSKNRPSFRVNFFQYLVKLTILFQGNL